MHDEAILPAASDRDAAISAVLDLPLGQIRADVQSALAHHVSIIVPTLRERDSIPKLLARIDAMRTEQGMNLEVLIMDDDSGDGIEEYVQGRGEDWCRVIVRKTNPGLSMAVLDGIRAADGEFIVVMDADLSHPPEAIPGMIEALERGEQFVIGSRFVEGGSTDSAWGLFRAINSRVATLLARPLTATSDPMAGFMALRRADTVGVADLSPIGFKIGLELIVKCGFRKVHEVPIHFQDRTHGESKLSFKEQVRYIAHLRRLYLFRFPILAQLTHFFAVGGLGAIVNLACLTAALAVGTPRTPALVFGILSGLASNFFLNRRLTFLGARSRPLIPQAIRFVSACAAGAVANFLVSQTLATGLLADYPLQVSASIGIIAGASLNYLGCRLWVFRGSRPSSN